MACQIVIRSLEPALINVCAKLEVFTFTHYEDTKDNAKYCKLGWFKVVKGHSRSMEITLSLFDRVHASSRLTFRVG